MDIHAWWISVTLKQPHQVLFTVSRAASVVNIAPCSAWSGCALYYGQRFLRRRHLLEETRPRSVDLSTSFVWTQHQPSLSLISGKYLGTYSATANASTAQPCGRFAMLEYRCWRVITPEAHRVVFTIGSEIRCLSMPFPI